MQVKMSSSGIFLLVFAAFFCTLFCLPKQVTYVDSINGHDNLSCIRSQVQPCQSLEYVQSHMKPDPNGSVVIEICEPGTNLTKALKFTNFTNISIRGEEGMNLTSIHCNTSSSGLSFYNVIGLTLNFIQLSNCGAEGNSTTYDPHTQKGLIITSALYILNCTDVNISNSVVYGSNGTGISMYDTNGKVYIENTDVVESFVRTSRPDLASGGGGMHIEFTYCTPGIVSNTCTRTGQNKNSIYTIRNCMLSGNMASKSKHLQSSSSTSWYNGRYIGSGGGTCLIFASNATNIDVTFYNCTFQDNYAQWYGGGLKIIFLDSVRENGVSLVKTKFLNNSVSNNAMGGGLQVSFRFYKLALGHLDDDDLPENNSIVITSCEFMYNHANSGGGVNVFSAELPLQDVSSAVNFSDCSWTGNTALYGAAVHIMPGVWASVNEGHYPRLRFSNCNISSNKVVPALSKVVPDMGFQSQVNGVGAFFSTQLSVIFHGETRFWSNTGTALYLSESIAKFSDFSQVTFDSNNGTKGGGISVMGRSFLVVGAFCYFTFINNTARQLGGGIYFQSTDSNPHQPCFIYRGFNISNSTFNFSSNRADGGRGHHMYVSSITSCNADCTLNSTYGCIGNFIFYNPHNQTNSTATLPTNFSTSNRLSSLTIFPGLSYQLPLVVKDLLGNNVSNVSYEAALVNKHSQSKICIDPAFNYISNNTINVQGQQKENATLRLDALSTDISLLMEIMLVDCPPGYVLNGGKCECGASSYYGVKKCDPEAYIMYGVWMGPCDGAGIIICTSDCPLGFCTHNTAHNEAELYYPVPLNASLLERAICSPSRTGTNCGECKVNRSVYFNSWTFNCGKEDNCYLGVIFFILSTIAPLTILFLVITIVDMNFVNGWNGFILYTQLVNSFYIYANGVIRFPALPYSVMESVLFVYSFFNLDFFDSNLFSFCLWKGATVIDILMVKLGSTCFALTLVFLTVFVLRQRKLTKYCPCFFRRRYTLINGISAFFILCYAQCSRTCFHMLDSVCLYDEHFICTRKIVFLNGNASLHLLAYFVVAIFLLFIVILPPVLLFFYPLFFRLLGFCNLSESRVVVYLWRLMPIQLLDSFQNPFKNNYRCFAGLYFLYRTSALLMHVLTKNLMQFYSAVQLQLVGMIVFHAVIQPYKERVHNVIDLLLFLIWHLSMEYHCTTMARMLATETVQLLHIIELLCG